MKNYFDEHRAIAYSDCPQNKFYHAKTPVAPDSVIICINRCGSVEQTPQDFFVQRDDSYYYNAIHFITSGSGTLFAGGKKYNLCAGNIFLINSYEPHRYESNPHDPMGLLWLEFAGNDVKRLIRYITQNNSHVLNGDAELFTLCADIIINAHQESYKTSAQIYNILMELCSKCSTLSKKQNDIAKNIQTYIDDNLNSDLSLSSIASHFGYNSNYFSDLFKRTTGITYNRYVNERKITQACSMLITTDFSIDQIAITLGFYDTSHFIKRFEKIIGMSPTAYRNCNGWLAK